MKKELIEFLGYIPINDWCEFEGCTRNAIDIRISKGIWQRGVHVIKPNGGKMMVNLKAAKKWLTESSHVA